MAQSARVGAEHAQSTDQHGHLRRGKGHPLRAVEQQFLRRTRIARALIVAETIGTRRKRDLLGAPVRRVERLLDAVQPMQHLGQLGRLVRRPILLRCQPDACTVGTVTLVGTAKGRRQ